VLGHSAVGSEEHGLVLGGEERLSEPSCVALDDDLGSVGDVGHGNLLLAS
jgi:hypothetical protein